LTLLKFTEPRSGETKGKPWKMCSGKVVDEENNVLSVQLGRDVLENPKELEQALKVQNKAIIADILITPRWFDSSITIEHFDLA